MHQFFPHQLLFSFSPVSCHIAGLGLKKKYWIFSTPSIPKFKNKLEHTVQIQLPTLTKKKKDLLSNTGTRTIKEVTINLNLIIQKNNYNLQM